MFKQINEFNVEIANTEVEMKFSRTDSGMELIVSDDDVQISTIFSFDDMRGLEIWLEGLYWTCKLGWNMYKFREEGCKGTSEHHKDIAMR